MLVAGGLALMGSSALGQQGCVIEADTVDPFTRERIIAVASDNYSGGPAYRWTARDQVPFLQLEWTRAGSSPVVVLEGDTLWLLLENDAILKLVSTRTEVGAMSRDASGAERSTGTYEYALSTSTAGVLNRHWVQRMRLYHCGGFQEFDAQNDPTWQYGFARSSGCFISTCAAEPVPMNAAIGEQKVVPVRAGE